MEENKEMQGMQGNPGKPEERTFTQSEVEAVLNQYRIKFEELQKELQRRDLSNFYQTLSVLFEIVRCKDAYSEDFVKRCVSTIEGSIENVFKTDVYTDEKVKDE